jgi:phosphoglycerate dehydrogenase-like enzyme
LGKIGRETARLAKAFDMRVIGSRRSPEESTPYVDALYGPADLDALLRQADYLVLATPHTNETEALIGERELGLLPPGAVFINIARGAVVNEPALIAALQSGHLRGAALDVFAVEPLPPDNPLWDMPNVIICPHSASTAISENHKIVQIFIDNLRSYLIGEPMQNVLDVERLY